MKKLKFLFMIFLPLLVPFFFYLNPFLAWPKDLIFEAAGYGNGVLAFFDAQKTGASAPCSWEHCSYLLGQISLMTVYKFFGPSTRSDILNTSLLAFLTVLTVYFFGRRLLGFRSGFLALLLFSGSLFFLMVLKTAYPYYGTGPLTASLTILLFLTSHQEKRKDWLFWSGAGMALVGLSGGQTIPLVLLILLSFLVWKILSGEKLFSFKNYLLTGLVSVLVFFGVHALFPLLNNNQPFEYLPSLYRMLTERGGQVAGVVNNFGEKIENSRRLLKAFFLDMNVLRQGHQHFLAGRAMLPLPLSLFFLLGVLRAILKRKDTDKMFLLWTGVVFIFYSFFADFQIRYFIIVAPVVYLLTAQGMFWLAVKINRKISVSLLILIIVFYLYGTYRDYYVILPKQAFKLEQFEGQEETADFVNQNYDPKTTFLVMGNVWSLSPQNFLFYTWGKNYQSYYWNYLWEKVLDPSIQEDFLGKRLINWEKEQLKSYQKIVYLFGFENIDLTAAREWQAFREIRPFLPVKKIIYNSRGLEQIGFYEVSKELSGIESRSFNLQKNEGQRFFAEKPAEIKALRVSGEMEKLNLFFNNKIFSLPIKILPGETLNLVSQGKSYFVFSPDFSTLESIAYRETNILSSPLAFLKSGSETKSKNELSELVYKLEAAAPIEKLEILFFPRIFHDRERQNYLRINFSNDDQNYQKAYEFKSDGSGGWSSPEERQKKIVIYPGTATVFLQFEFSGEEAELFSGGAQKMTITGEFNWQLPRLKTQAGENWLGQNGSEAIKLDLFF